MALWADFNASHTSSISNLLALPLDIPSVYEKLTSGNKGASPTRQIHHPISNLLRLSHPQHWNRCCHLLRHDCLNLG